MQITLGGLTRGEFLLLKQIVDSFSESVTVKGKPWSDGNGNHHASLKLSIPEMLELEQLKKKLRTQAQQ